MTQSSASFQIDPGTGTYGGAGTPQAVSSLGATVNCKLVSTEGVTTVSWTCTGTDGVSAAVSFSLSGSPSGQIASFTFPAGTGRAYLIQCDVNGGSAVTGRSADTAKGIAYSLNDAGAIPLCFGETYEHDSTSGWTSRVNVAMQAYAPGQATTGDLLIDGAVRLSNDPADILDEFWDVNDARLRRDDSGDCVAILSRGNNQTAFKSTGAPPAVGTCPYTGRAMLVFDGSSNENLLASTGKVRLSSTTERTLWFLKRCTGITGSVQYIYTTTSNAEAIRITGSGGITSFYDGGNRSFGVTGNARLEAYCVRINSDGTMDLFRNGYKLATYDSTTVLPDDLTSKRVRIGANDAGSGNGWTGELHAWGWADSALTDAQILSLQRWVNHHYHKAGVRTLVPYTGGSTVMWFGDSITSTALSAGSDHYSYRTTVMAHLVGFEALGQLTTGTYTSPHEAVSGDDFDDATARIAAAASANPDPTYIVCALGTNDAAGAKTVTDEMSDFVTALAASFPSATILVPTIPPNTLGSNQTYIDTYHQNMWDEIDTLAGTGIDVIGVDISSTVTTDDVSGDGTHPDTTGHEKMGDAWIAFFEKRLGIA